MGISNYLEEEIIKHTLGISPYTNASPVYAALLINVNNNDQSYTEVSGGGYLRVAINPSDLSAANEGTISNINEFTWPVALTDWGSIKHIAVFDASSNGNMLWYGDLNPNKFSATSSIFKILVGGFTITTVGAFSLYLRNGILDFVLRNVALSVPAVIYAGVGTATGNLNSSINEPSGSGYSRIEITAVSQISNGQYEINTPDPITFMADGGDWGIMSKFGIWDASSNGNLLYALDFDNIREISNGDGMEFGSGAVTIRVQ